MEQLNYENILETVKKWVRQVGVYQMEMFKSDKVVVQNKGLRSDLVTQVDKESEDMLIDLIKEIFPDHAILGEERGASNNKGKDDHQWVIDPLDGTVNYTQGLPIFCQSIALKKGKETKIGVVYAPYLNEMFTAVQGKGAFFNGKKIQVTEKDQLADFVLGTGFPYDKGTHKKNNVQEVARMIPQIRGIRRLGAAAYDLALVACGRLDGYWEYNLKEWDVCAGNLLVKEAGGVVENICKDRGISLMAGSMKSVEAMRSVILT